MSNYNLINIAYSGSFKEQLELNPRNPLFSLKAKRFWDHV